MSEAVTGGCSDGARRPNASELKKSPTICDTDLPRRPASILAVRINSASMRSVSFVCMTYTLCPCIRLVNLQGGGGGEKVGGEVGGGGEGEKVLGGR